MKQKYFKLLFVPLMVPIVFSSLICCCLSDHARAEDSHHQSSGDIPASSQDDANAHDPQDHHSSNHKCECSQLLSTLAENFDILKAADVVLYSFNRQIVLDKIFLTFVPDSHHSLIGPSPPQFSSSSIPLYVKNPSLRI